MLKKEERKKNSNDRNANTDKKQAQSKARIKELQDWWTELQVPSSAQELAVSGKHGCFRT